MITKFVLIFYKIFEEFLIIRRTDREKIINVLWSSCKVPIHLVRKRPDEISKNTQISSFMKIRKVKAQFFHKGERTHGRTDGQMNRRTEGEKYRRDEANSGFSQF